MFTSAGATIDTIIQTSLCQGLTATALLGRVTAARRFLVFSLAPVGAAMGSLLVGAAISLVALLLLSYSPVRQVCE